MRRTSPARIEPLENRQLLAGVTMLMHGHEGNITGWIAAAASAMARRIGESEVSQYVMKVGKVAGEVVVKSFTLEKGPELNKSAMAEAIVKLDWTEIDDGSVSTKDIGKTVADYLMTSHGTMRPLAELPMQFIGHSRGGSLVVAITQQLGAAGVWVDQNTYLDPHPVGAYFGFGYDDADMKVYSNVVFADDYWRDDGRAWDADPDGEPVDGSRDGDLNDTVQKKYVVSAHMGVTSYYQGTIDYNAASNGDHPIFEQWYGDTPDKPARTLTGFYYTRVFGGARPADGLNPAFGGSADRTQIDADGSQWSNIGDLRILQKLKFQVGEKITLRYLNQDRDSGGQLTVFLDVDRNPYNENHIRTMRRLNITASDSVTAARVLTSTDGVEPGKYYIFARYTDSAGHSRFTYARRIELTAAPAQPAASAPPAVPLALTPSSIVTAVTSAIDHDVAGPTDLLDGSMLA